MFFRLALVYSFFLSVDGVLSTAASTADNPTKAGQLSLHGQWPVARCVHPLFLLWKLECERGYLQTLEDSISCVTQ